MKVNQVIDVHAHILLPGVMGSCGVAGPEMGFRANGNEFFRAGDYVLENVNFNNSPFSVPQKRVEKMAQLGIDLQLVSPNPITTNRNQRSIQIQLTKHMLMGVIAIQNHHHTLTLRRFFSNNRSNFFIKA